MFIAFPLTNRAARACSLRNLEDGLSEASVRGGMLVRVRLWGRLLGAQGLDLAGRAGFARSFTMEWMTTRG